MAVGSHFGCPKLTLYRISYHFRSIPQFLIFVNFFTKWLLATILDVRKSLSIAFLAILDQYRIFYFFAFLKNGCRRTFWMSENHFRSHFWPFQINTKLFYLEIFQKMSVGAHFGCPKFRFDRISGHFRSIRNFIFFGKF